ncbi:unnamed protein product [Pleuronectes platessa]|uniref:Uncharacterized protein n=1 Tax=Pleuronectes platessa TaxID=8262 RepID=A0A9N7YW76_PLEPL|nr:unnamed protein product [Pleuronectes platessa]
MTTQQEICVKHVHNGQGHVRIIQYNTSITCLSILQPIVPSLVNKTPRYLNSITWVSNSLPTWREQYTVFRQRTMASNLEVLTLIPTASHSAATPVRTGGHGLMKPREPHHLLKKQGFPTPTLSSPQATAVLSGQRAPCEALTLH